MKKAFIVSAEVRVRVVVDVPEHGNANEAAINAARKDIIDSVLSDYRALVEVEEDKECPYGELRGEDDQSEPALDLSLFRSFVEYYAENVYDYRDDYDNGIDLRAADKVLGVVYRAASGQGYTNREILDLCKGNTDLADHIKRRVLEEDVDARWHIETLLEEYLKEGEIKEKDGTYQFVSQDEPQEAIPAPELAAIESRAGMLGRMRVTLESTDAMTRLELASLLAGYTPPEGLTFRLGDDPDDRDVFITRDGVTDPERWGLMPFLDYSTGTLLAMLARVEGYYKHKALQNK